MAGKHFSGANTNQNNNGAAGFTPASAQRTQRAQGQVPSYARAAQQRQAAQYARTQRAQTAQNQGAYAQQNPYMQSAYGNNIQIPTKPKKRGFRPWMAILIILVLVLAAGGACAYTMYKSVVQVKDDAKQVMDVGKGLVSQVKDGNTEGLANSATTIAQLTSEMKVETSSTMWDLATKIPVYGNDVAEARQLIDIVDTLASEAMVPACQQLDGVTLNSLLVDGGVDVATLQTLLDTLTTVSTPIREAEASINNLGTCKIEKLNNYITQAKEAFSGVDTALDLAEQVGPYIPQILGANGQTRNYLIMAEQNAESRCIGGFPGAWGVMSITDGILSMGEFQSVTNLDDSQAVSITDEERRLFVAGSVYKMATRSGDTWGTFDFYRAANLTSQMWTTIYGTSVDGVVAVDTTMLSYLMAFTGNVTTSTGDEVTAENVVDYLSNTAYVKYMSDSDAVFGEVAKATFSGLMGSLNGGDISAIYDAFKKGISEGRFKVYLANEQERVLTELLGCTGQISFDETVAPVTGIYLNDYTYAKMEYYLDFQTNMSEARDNGDGTYSYDITATFTNTISEDAISSLNWYVLGAGGGEASGGSMAIRVYFVAPAGGSIYISSRDGGGLELTTDTYQSLNLEWGRMILSPGETCTVTYTITTSAACGGQPLSLDATPTCKSSASIRAETSSNALDAALGSGSNEAVASDATATDMTVSEEIAQ